MYAIRSYYADKLDDRLSHRVVADEQVAASGIAFDHPAVGIEHRHADRHRLELVAQPGELDGELLSYNFV